MATVFCGTDMAGTVSNRYGGVESRPFQARQSAASASPRSDKTVISMAPALKRGESPEVQCRPRLQTLSAMPACACIPPSLVSLDNSSPQDQQDLPTLVYQELRSLAAARMATQVAGHTLQPTALVHEAWLRLKQTDHAQW